MRKVLVAVLAGLLCMFALQAQAAPSAPAAPASPPPSGDPLAGQLQQQLQEQALISATQASLSNELDAARSSQQSLVDLVGANQTAIQQTLAQLAAAEQQFNDATNREASEHAAAAAARHREDQDKQLLAIFVRLGYEQQQGVVAYLLSSSSMSDLFSRAADISNLMHRSTDLTKQIAADATAAETAEAAAAHDAAAAQQAATQLQQQQQTLQQQTDHAKDLIGQLGVQAAATAQEIQQANTQSAAVAQQIAQTRLEQLDQSIGEAEQAAWQEAEYYLQNHLGTLPSSFGTPPLMPIDPKGSQLAWPGHGLFISQGFGPTTYPFEPAFGGFAHFHTGIDLAGPMGTPLVATADGVVVAADSGTQGYGNHLIIAHAGGVLTLYGHLEAMLVKPGDAVKQGQVVALLGSTGNSTGPHCHFEVRVSGQPVDPRPFLPTLPAGAAGP